MNSPYTLIKSRVLEVFKENHNTITINIENVLKNAKPGQFVMFYAFGKGEIPITIASIKDNIATHTIRIVGSVSHYFEDVNKNDMLYLRGPYGNHWPLEKAYKKPLIIISGGLGLAATRWIVETSISQKHKFEDILCFYGFKSYEDMIYKDIIKRWEQSIKFYSITEKPSIYWNKKTGMITELINEVSMKSDSIVFLCGPDLMVNACINILFQKGILKENIYISLERHMKCAIGACGHCMIGPYFVCKDGAIFNYANIEYFFTKRGC